MSESLTIVKQKQILTPPSLPEDWNYEQSIEKIEPLIYQWKNLTIDIVKELWIAREKLSVKPDDAGKLGAEIRWHGTNSPRYTWASYCESVG